MEENKTKKVGLYQKFFKRAFDFSIALVAILILWPIMLVVSLISLCSIGHPVIFAQYRPGKDGKIFKLYKFRSMSNKKDKNGKLLPDSERITKWGKFIRKTSLDELPQLFNILKGDLSIVGPRPRLVKDMVFYDEDVLKAYSVRPGLTGPAQVYDRNSESSWESVFERDLEYANNVTFKNDFKLFIGTFTAVFKGGSVNGAESNGKKREYYYPDHLLKSGKITKDQYNKGLEKASEIIENKGQVVYQKQLHKKEKIQN